MKKYQKIIIVVFILLFIPILTACNDTLKEKEFVIEEITSMIPNSELIQVKNKDRERVYIFDTDDFSFTYRDYIYDDSVFGFDTNAHECDYLEHVLDVIVEDIEEAAEDKNIYFVDNRDSDYNTDELEKLKTQNEITCVLNYSGHMALYITKYDNISTVFNFFDELKDIYDDYLFVKESSILEEDLTLGVYYIEDFKDTAYNANYIYHSTNRFTKETFELKLFKKWTEYLFKDYVRQNLISDSINLSNHTPYIINKLYIDGKCFKSKQYDIEFLYNLENDTYYTKVCYGTILEKHDIEDYLQREIIEDCYHKANYTIDSEKRETTYSIGKNDYKIKYYNGLNESYLKFYKNNKQLKIETTQTIGNTSTNTYYFYIPLEDFAELMEMEVAKINESECVVYLETK